MNILKARSWGSILWFFLINFALENLWAFLILGFYCLKVKQSSILQLNFEVLSNPDQVSFQVILLFQKLIDFNHLNSQDFSRMPVLDARVHSIFIFSILQLQHRSLSPSSPDISESSYLLILQFRQNSIWLSSFIQSNSPFSS